MHNLAEYIEIRNVEGQLILSCKGEFCTQDTILSTEKSQNICIKKNDEPNQEIIQGVIHKIDLEEEEEEKRESF